MKVCKKQDGSQPGNASKGRGPAPKSIQEYKVGNSVWLSTKNIKTKKPLKNPNHKLIGPYKVKKLVGLLYQLKLSTSIKIHDVFYHGLLQKASANPLLSQHNDSTPSIIIDNKEKWEVDDILDARKK